MTIERQETDRLLALMASSQEISPPFTLSLNSFSAEEGEEGKSRKGDESLKMAEDDGGMMQSGEAGDGSSLPPACSPFKEQREVSREGLSVEDEGLREKKFV